MTSHIPEASVSDDTARTPTPWTARILTILTAVVVIGSWSVTATLAHRAIEVGDAETIATFFGKLEYLAAAYVLPAVLHVAAGTAAWLIWHGTTEPGRRSRRYNAIAFAVYATLLAGLTATAAGIVAHGQPFAIAFGAVLALCGPLAVSVRAIYRRSSRSRSSASTRSTSASVAAGSPK